jgi:NTE family protein
LLIAVQNTVRDQLDACHLVLDPPECRSFGTFEFDKAQDIFDVGYAYGKSVVTLISSQIGI